MSNRSPWRSRDSARSRSRLELAELVGQRLAGVADVSVHLVGDVVLAEGRVLDHEVDRPLPRPAQRVHAGVDHQAGGTPRVEGEDAEAIRLRREQAHLFGEALGVQAPALDVGGAAVEATERGQLASTSCMIAELQVVARHGLVEGKRLGLVARPRFGGVGVDVVLARAAAVGGRLAVVGDRRVLLLVRRHDDDLARRLRQPAEPLADRAVGAFERRSRGRLDLLARAEVQRRVLTQGPKGGGEPIGPEQAGAELDELAVDPGDLLQTDRVHVLGDDIQRGVRRVSSRYASVPPGMCASPGSVSGRAAGAISSMITAR